MISYLAPVIGVLCLWMIACAWCGYQRRYVGFLAVLLGGLALNALGMAYLLNAQPFEANALMAQTAAVLYAFCAFGVGWFAGRIRRAWRESRAE